MLFSWARALVNENANVYNRIFTTMMAQLKVHFSDIEKLLWPVNLIKDGRWGNLLCVFRLLRRRRNAVEAIYGRALNANTLRTSWHDDVIDKISFTRCGFLENFHVSAIVIEYALYGWWVASMRCIVFLCRKQIY